MRNSKKLLGLLLALTMVLFVLPPQVQADTTPVLEIKYVDSYQLAWNDDESGGDHDGAYYRPVVPSGYCALGYYGQSDYGSPFGLAVAVKALPADPSAVAHPTGYTRVWNDAGSGADLDGHFWLPIPPTGYKALGMVVTSGGTPSVNDIWCVKDAYVLGASVGTFIWDDTATGANTQFGSWQIKSCAGGVSSGSFLGVAGTRTAPSTHALLWCLNDDYVQVADVTGVANNNASKLAALSAYAPRIWLASGEQFMPSSVDWAFQYMERYQNANDGNRYWIRTIEELDSPSDWTLPVFAGNLSTAPVYAFWADKNNNKVDLVYFFYYPYNRGKELVSTMWGNHVGDWERLTVRCEKVVVNNVMYLRPATVYVAIHSFGCSYAWSDFTKTSSTHPVAYSAQGSHGTWKDAGNFTYEETVLGDLVDVCNQGTAWDTWNNIAAFDYNNLAGLNTTWPGWLSNDYTNAGSGDPTVPGNGAIFRWGNEQDGGPYFGYWRLEEGPTGPIEKGCWNPDILD